MRRWYVALGIKLFGEKHLKAALHAQTAEKREEVEKKVAQKAAKKSATPQKEPRVKPKQASARATWTKPKGRTNSPQTPQRPGISASLIKELQFADYSSPEATPVKTSAASAASERKAAKAEERRILVVAKAGKAGTRVTTGGGGVVMHSLGDRGGELSFNAREGDVVGSVTLLAGGGVVFWGGDGTRQHTLAAPAIFDTNSLPCTFTTQERGVVIATHLQQRAE